MIVSHQWWIYVCFQRTSGWVTLSPQMAPLLVTAKPCDSRLTPVVQTATHCSGSHTKMQYSCCQGAFTNQYAVSGTHGRPRLFQHGCSLPLQLSLRVAEKHNQLPESFLRTRPRCKCQMLWKWLKSAWHKRTFFLVEQSGGSSPVGNDWLDEGSSAEQRQSEQ